MEKTVIMRSLYRAFGRRSVGLYSSAAVNHASGVHLNHSSLPSFSHRRLPCVVLMTGFQPSFITRIGSTRHFSESVSRGVVIRDLEAKRAFNDLMAANWVELPPALVDDVKNVLSESMVDEAGQEVLANAFETAQLVEKFNKILTSKTMGVDDNSGKDVKQLPEESVNTLRFLHKIYHAYLKGFGPEKSHLKNKVESELGTKLDLKMRLCGLSSE